MEYAGEIRDLDQPILDAVKERPGKAIRLRVQPMILRGPVTKGLGGQYQGWSNVSWTLECDTAEEAFAIREALRAFFLATSEQGPLVVQQLLERVPVESTTPPDDGAAV